MLRFWASLEVRRSLVSQRLYEITIYVDSSVRLVGRDFRLNCIQKQELRRYDPRSKSPRNNAFSTPFRLMVQAEVTAPGRQDRCWVAILDQ